MATDIFLVITDERGTVLAGESQTSVYDPYSKTTVAKPTQIGSVEGMTEQTYAIGSGGGTGSGAGKIVFDPFVVDKSVDNLSPTIFIAQATGVAWKFVDLLFVKTNGQDGPSPKPFLAYRLGTVGISQIASSSDDETVRERVSFVFGSLQIGYQLYKIDGTPLPFTSVGWDRIRNIKI